MDNVINLIKDKPVFVPRVLLRSYKNLGISDEELVLIMIIMTYGEKVVYDPEMFALEINGNKKQIMRIIDSLCDKNILSLIIEKNDKKAYEFISLEPLYEKLLNITLDKEEEKEIDNSIFSKFEEEFGRTLSPMEYEKIKEWITSGNSTELIECALREAVMNKVDNLNYIDRILASWQKKGYKNRNDVMKDKESFRNKKDKVQVFDTDWLNE